MAKMNNYVDPTALIAFREQLAARKCLGADFIGDLVYFIDTALGGEQVSMDSRNE